ncbi:MAG TPA: FtsX-like permease family protein [Bacteroidales bacterium]|nr:FtsX-like permease family protein [Bacteroidales bacterium]HSA43966.1 FtsX-like permease family protein [Bacteroidales bacterium]
MILILAWRNIWRNRRRTLITIASVFFALLFALLMRALQVGTYDHMLRSMLDAYTGYIQVYSTDYYYDRSIDHLFEQDEAVMAGISEIPGVKAAIPRLETFALAITARQTKGVMLLGIDPEREKLLSNPAGRITQGRYYRAGEGGLLLAGRLAAYLGVEPGDTLTLMGMGCQGASAAGLFVVRGILKLPNPDLDRRLIYIDLPSVREYTGCSNMLSSIVINLDDVNQTAAIRDRISHMFSDKTFRVLTYEENSPELIQQIDSDKASGYIFLGLLYLIVGFGVFGTVLMMISERRKETGVMAAIGMQRLKLALVVVTEMLWMGLLGIASSYVVSIPLVWYLQEFPIRFTGEMGEIYLNYGLEPIMPARLDLMVNLWQALIVLLIIFISVIYPVISIFKMKETEALRS